MHHIDQLLEQQEVAWIRSYACPDQDAIESLLFELALNDRRRSFAEIGETRLHAVPETSQFVFSGPDAGEYLRRIQARRVARLRQINQCRATPGAGAEPGRGRGDA